TLNPVPSDQSQPVTSQGSSLPAKPDVHSNTQSNLNPPPIPNPESHSAPDSSAIPPRESNSAQASSVPQSTATQTQTQAPADTLSAATGSLPAPPQAVAKAPVVQPWRAPDAGESQLTLARQYLDGRSRPRNPAAASQLLWSAVEKGNSVAEMDLADLYL